MQVKTVFFLYFSLKLECEKLAQEKTEIQRQYIMVNKVLSFTMYSIAEMLFPSKPKLARKTFPIAVYFYSKLFYSWVLYTDVLRHSFSVLRDVLWPQRRNA